MRAFSDLRLNGAAGQTDESFWPSFTDIMMVVVMIFLISSSVLIMRNWELIRQITETAEAEREAAEEARISIAENATLEERLAATEQQLAMTRLQLLRSLEQKAGAQRLLEREQARNEALDRERDSLQSQLAESGRRSQQLSAELSSLRARLDESQQQASSSREQLVQTEQRLSSASDELTEVRSELARSQRELAALQRELSDASERYSLLREQLQRSTDRLAERQGELSEARSRIDLLDADRQRRDAELAEAEEREVLSEERLEELRAEYRELKAKYDKLVRPARTTKGKYVVSLRYSGIDGERIIQLREPDEDAFRRVSETQMHRQLGALKERLGGELYIRIIFPEDSQLTYNEAWSFTTEILNQYDYYYQDGGPPTLEESPAEASPADQRAQE